MFKKILGALALPLFAAGAHAATSSAVLTVGATVLNVCLISDAVMLFGNLSTLTSVLGVSATPAVDATVQVPVLCSSGTAASIEGGAGLNAASGNRRMKHLLAASYLPYSLFRDAGRTQAFGTGGAALSYTGTGLPDTVTLYGRITGPTVDAALPGIYADSVSLVLTYTP